MTPEIKPNLTLCMSVLVRKQVLCGWHLPPLIQVFQVIVLLFLAVFSMGKNSQNLGLCPLSNADPLQQVLQESAVKDRASISPSL